VEFAGFVPDVRQRLAQADVLVMPSLSEGLGVAVLEAMAMGKPVVASNTGGLPEAVADGETGLLVPPGNAEALAGALLALLEDPDRAQAMGKAGRRRAVDHFDRRVIVDRMLSLYREVLSGV
jgi:glycosyltransferase involved in cell wall biosynthesis